VTELSAPGGGDTGLTATIEDATLAVTPVGDLDMAAAFRLEPEIERLLATPGARRLALNLSEVGFIDSTGLGALLSIRERAVRLGIEFEIASASASVERLLEVTGTRDLFDA
jgi:anti-anti-sigma factor